LNFLIKSKPNKLNLELSWIMTITYFGKLKTDFFGKIEMEFSMPLLLKDMNKLNKIF